MLLCEGRKAYINNFSTKPHSPNFFVRATSKFLSSLYSYFICALTSPDFQKSIFICKGLTFKKIILEIWWLWGGSEEILLWLAYLPSLCPWNHKRPIYSDLHVFIIQATEKNRSKFFSSVLLFFFMHFDVFYNLFFGNVICWVFS